MPGAGLPDLIRGHLDGCPLCLDFKECSTGALLYAQVEFEGRRRFRLWLDGVECLFFPVADSAWHVRYSFPVNGRVASLHNSGHFLTAHYTGNPAGSLRAFEQTIDYARLMLLSASEDLLDHLHGVRPPPAIAGLPCPDNL